jgi:hypothetical protein
MHVSIFFNLVLSSPIGFWGIDTELTLPEQALIRQCRVTRHFEGGA